jgi:RimJ/RimL family protein N-acetyltransferase
MPYFRKLVGTRCYLSPMDPSDAERYAAWVNDLGLTRYLTLASAQIGLEAEREAISRLAKGYNFSVVDSATDSLLGSCGLMDVNEVNRSAACGIFLGDRTVWGKGYGTEALSLLADYSFNVLNLRSLHLWVFEYNERAMASYRKVGFKEAGRLRKSHYYGGRYHDEILMDLLAEEFGPSRLPPAE